MIKKIFLATAVIILIGLQQWNLKVYAQEILLVCQQICCFCAATGKEPNCSSEGRVIGNVQGAIELQDYCNTVVCQDLGGGSFARDYSQCTNIDLKPFHDQENINKELKDLGNISR